MDIEDAVLRAAILLFVGVGVVSLLVGALILIGAFVVSVPLGRTLIALFTSFGTAVVFVGLGLGVRRVRRDGGGYGADRSTTAKWWRW